MIYVSKLAYPGSIATKRGQVDLCKLSQKKLKELYDDGCKYIDVKPGDPPFEGPIEAKKVVPKKPTKAKKTGKSVKEQIKIPDPEPEEIPDTLSNPDSAQAEKAPE